MHRITVQALLVEVAAFVGMIYAESRAVAAPACPRRPHRREAPNGAAWARSTMAETNPTPLRIEALSELGGRLFDHAEDLAVALEFRARNDRPASGGRGVLEVRQLALSSWRNRPDADDAGDQRKDLLNALQEVSQG
jgi:hypothetical protein